MKDFLAPPLQSCPDKGPRKTGGRPFERTNRTLTFSPKVDQNRFPYEKDSRVNYWSDDGGRSLCHRAHAALFAFRLRALSEGLRDADARISWSNSARSRKCADPVSKTAKSRRGDWICCPISQLSRCDQWAWTTSSRFVSAIPNSKPSGRNVSRSAMSFRLRIPRPTAAKPVSLRCGKLFRICALAPPLTELRTRARA